MTHFLISITGAFAGLSIGALLSWIDNGKEGKPIFYSWLAYLIIATVLTTVI